MNRRIMQCLESRCLLSPHQFGFHAGREVLGACCRLADDVVEAFCHRQQVQAVTLDIQVAYNTVWHAGLLKKMTAKGIPSYLIQWRRAFLLDRETVLEIREHSLEVHPKCGLPQGSPLSCTLFLIFIDDLLHILHRIGRVRLQAFADDLILWILGDFHDGVIHPSLRHALRTVSPSRGNQYRYAVILGPPFTGPLCHTSSAFGTWECGLTSILHGANMYERRSLVPALDCGSFGAASGMRGGWTPFSSCIWSVASLFRLCSLVLLAGSQCFTIRRFLQS